MKKLFCRLFGHTWVFRVIEPDIRWNARENMHEMGPTVIDGEPQMFQECARCHARRPWDAGGEGVPAARHAR